MTTTDIVIEEPVPPGQEESKDAKNEAPTVEDPVDQDGGSDIDNDGSAFNDNNSDDSSCSSNSSSDSSRSDESSVFSSPETYASDLYM